MMSCGNGIPGRPMTNSKGIIERFPNSGVYRRNDTSRQKEIICELIDLCDGDTIYLDWDDKDVSKQKAKDYVLNYSRV